MQPADLKQISSGLWITSLGTLVSRVIGMLRDVATAALFGLSAGGVLDALVIAFRIPSLMLALFGEGALAVGYLPTITGALERDRRAAWTLVSVMLFWFAVGLTVLLVLGEALCGAVWLAAGGSKQASLLAGLIALLMPYMLFTCLAAQLAATLHALGHFCAPALSTAMLNLAWLLGAWWIAPLVSDDPRGQAHVLAACILAAGAVQLASQWWVLRKFGFRLRYNWHDAKGGVRTILHASSAIFLGMLAVSVNSAVDGVIAWGLAAPPGSAGIPWLGGITYPLEQGAASAIFLAERVYGAPVGLLGVAVATVMFPVLSRHAARGDAAGVGANLTMSLRLILFFGIPASVAVVLFAEPVVKLLFQHGQFSDYDALRTARMTAVYGCGVWAYCAMPILTRSYYALGEFKRPLRLGLYALAVNCLLNLTLIWPLGEIGLAVGTAVSASLGVLAMAFDLARLNGHVRWTALWRTTWKVGLATSAMSAAVIATGQMSPDFGESMWDRAVALTLPLSIAGAMFFLAAKVLRCAELRHLFAARSTQTS